jgi:hypothetical protein
MKYSLTFEADDIRELAHNLLVVGARLSGAPETIAQPTATTIAPAVLTEVALADPAAQQPVKARVYDYATEIAPRVLALVDKKGRDAAKALLADFGAAKASEIDASRHAELVAALDAAATA